MADLACYVERVMVQSCAVMSWTEAIERMVAETEEILLALLAGGVPMNHIRLTGAVVECCGALSRPAERSLDRGALLVRD